MTPTRRERLGFETERIEYFREPAIEAGREGLGAAPAALWLVMGRAASVKRTLAEAC